MKGLVILLLAIPCLLALPTAKHSGIVPLKNVGSRIVNGDRAVAGQFPWQAALTLTLTSFCGGSLISNHWILTAGHCVDGQLLFEARLGTLSPDGGANSVSQLSFSYILHEGYTSERELANDIGLVELSSPVVFTDTIQPIPLSSDVLGVGVDFTVSGWGKISDASNTVSSFLNYVTLRTISNDDCNQVYGDEIRDEMVCATYTTAKLQSTCNGDSGGPAIVTNPSTQQVAIVSFVSDTGCESGAPSGYTRVATYRTWIQQNTGV